MSVSVITGVSANAEASLATILGSAGSLNLVRRCADLAEVVAVCAAGRADVALVSADLPGLDQSVLRELQSHGVRVIGVYADEFQERTLREWAVPWLLSAEVTERDLLDTVDAAASTTPVAVREPAPFDVDPEPVETQEHAGKVVVVWGTGGAPGRSVVAANLAAEFAAAGESTLLIDADTHGATQAQLFGILDEAPGIAAATRLAEAGRLDTVALAGVAPLLDANLRILTGLPRPDRWPELRTAALETVLDVARATHRWVVVDVAAPIEADEELSFDTVAPQRNAATRAMLDGADEVLVVAAGDPIGLTRLVRTIDDVADVSSATFTVVVTKVRASAAGSSPETQIADALQRFTAIEPVLVPDDRDALDAALLAGRCLAESAPSSPVVSAVREIALERMGRPTGKRRSRRMRMSSGRR